ncbi:MAG: cyclopropane-fatty-acyl-phospholipid synthase family protein [Dokdonella sp.]
MTTEVLASRQTKARDIERSAHVSAWSPIALAERGRLPDSLIRLGIRRLCAERLRTELGGSLESAWERFRTVLGDLGTSSIAIETDAANAQHYELPPRFFELCLGHRLKYSSCYWDETTADLDAAEERMLVLYAERAQLTDGQHILELGCGWGSLTLWMAERYPHSRITAVSNSRPQREFIEARCRDRGFANVRVITEDINQLQLASTQFDRVVSIEMFEHVRNYEHLLLRIADWLRPGGKLFVHIFCHREFMYPFETDGKDDWMGKYFFTGGLMPAADTLLHFQRDLNIEEQWRLSGTHYEKTANAWLVNQDRHRDEILRVLGDAYGADAKLWHQRWRMFWMACAELFGYDHGNEWMVGHYRFAKP